MLKKNFHRLREIVYTNHQIVSYVCTIELALLVSVLLITVATSPLQSTALISQTTSRTNSAE
jgi:hypothetical protein